MKMWAGRFKELTDAEADAFNTSLPFDKRLYKQDIAGSIAHCTMLGECNIIDKSHASKICEALKLIQLDIENGKLVIDNAEDIHMFIEQELTARIGDIGKKLHTARSRNDQVALDIRLYLRQSIDDIIILLKNLSLVLTKISNDNIDTLMPAFTHMQKAQPTTLAHHLCAYCQMFLRDIERLTDCRKRVNRLPLGSCACTATSFPIDRKRVASLLGFEDICYNSLDAVSDRDFAIEFISCCSQIIMHLSRFNEEIIYWSTDSFNYITLPDRFSTGSSIMPQKKNPDMNELIRGKSGRVFGGLLAILTLMKGLPLSYNKDMQEDKELIFDADDTIKVCLKIFTAMIGEIKFNKKVMAQAAISNFTLATECADYLAKKDIPFRAAHEITGKIVIYCIDNNKTLQQLSLQEFKTFCDIFDNDIHESLKVENVISSRKVEGGPAPKTVLEEIKQIKKKLENL